MRLDVSVVLQQIANLKLQCPEAFEDGEDQLLRDMLEAETEIDEFLTALVKLMRLASRLAGGIAMEIADMELRQKRFERREQAVRGLIFQIMNAADIRKRELPLATLSIARGQRRVIGDADPRTVPDDLCKIKREVNRSAIKEALETGRTVPGYQLSNAEPHLTVRTR